MVRINGGNSINSVACCTLYLKTNLKKEMSDGDMFRCLCLLITMYQVYILYIFARQKEESIYTYLHHNTLSCCALRSRDHDAACCYPPQACV